MLTFLKKQYTKILKNLIEYYTKNKLLVISLYSIFIIITLYLNIYLPLILGIFLVLYSIFIRIPYLKNLKQELKKDAETMEFHWKNDRDLIILGKISNFCLFISFILFSYIAFIIVSFDYPNTDLGSNIILFNSEIVNVMLVFFSVSRLIVFFCELDIIFRRNTPTYLKFLGTCNSCVKFAVMPFAGLWVMDIVSFAINLTT